MFSKLKKKWKNRNQTNSYHLVAIVSKGNERKEGARVGKGIPGAWSSSIFVNNKLLPPAHDHMFNYNHNVA